MFEEIEADMLHESDSPTTISFLKNYRSTWRDGYGPEAFSAHDTMKRTNNYIEAYDRQINKFVKGKFTENSYLCKITAIKRWIIPVKLSV